MPPKFPVTFDIVDNATGEVVNSVTVETGMVSPTTESLALFGYTHHRAERVSDV